MEDEACDDVPLVMSFPLPGVTPPHALREALWAAATAAGTNEGADTGSRLLLIAAVRGSEPHTKC